MNSSSSAETGSVLKARRLSSSGAGPDVRAAQAGAWPSARIEFARLLRLWLHRASADPSRTRHCHRVWWRRRHTRPDRPGPGPVRAQLLHQAAGGSGIAVPGPPEAREVPCRSGQASAGRPGASRCGSLRGPYATRAPSATPYMRWPAIHDHSGLAERNEALVDASNTRSTTLYMPT